MDWMITGKDGAIRKARVLVIDDDTFIGSLVKQMLVSIGIHDVTLATDGIHALQVLRDNEGDFDLIVCDLAMPNMDGMSFIDYTRQGKAYCAKDTPILVLTVSADAPRVRKAAGLGINGYLLKPLSITHLEEKVRAALPPAIDARPRRDLAPE